MPTTIYDSSALTKRAHDKAVAGNFVRRLQSNQTGYTTPIGIYDQSVINTVQTGQMRQFTKNSSGVTVVNNGCPCNPLTSEEAGSCGCN